VATANLQSQYNGNWTLVMAATTLAIAPLLILFLVFQRSIIQSISITGFR
jgi:multiple sugar transport system permease protein